MLEFSGKISYRWCMACWEQYVKIHVIGILILTIGSWQQFIFRITKSSSWPTKTFFWKNISYAINWTETYICHQCNFKSNFLGKDIAKILWKVYIYIISIKKKEHSSSSPGKVHMLPRSNHFREHRSRISVHVVVLGHTCKNMSSDDNAIEFFRLSKKTYYSSQMTIKKNSHKGQAKA